MPRLKSWRFEIGDPGDESGTAFPDSRYFSCDVNVTAEGEFSCCLPEDVVALFDKYGVELKYTLRGRRGGFQAHTMDSLREMVEAAITELVSRELVGKKLVIRYQLDTHCNYFLHKGEVYPNGYYFSDDEIKRYKLQWREGTDSDPGGRPYQVRVYVGLAWRKEYRYKSGRTVVDYDDVGFHIHEDDAIEEFGGPPSPNQRWLVSLREMGPDDRWSGKNGEILEVDYSEEVAQMFVNAIKFICMVNESLAKVRTPQQLLQAAKNAQALLPAPQPHEEDEE